MQILIPGEEWRWPAGADALTVDTPVVPGAERATPELLAQARQTIDRIRKSDLTVRVVNGRGEPVSGVPVRIEQTRHAFPFGFPVFRSPNDPDVAVRDAQEGLARIFNAASALCYWNEFWHYPVEKHPGRRELGEFCAAVDWAASRGLTVKGHPLVWTVGKAIPTFVLAYDETQRLRILEQHVRGLIRAGAGRVGMWDLCNEMLWEPSLRHVEHRNWPHIEPIEEILTYLEPAVHWAREEDPSAVLSINEYGLETSPAAASGVSAEMQRDRLRALVEALASRGAAVDAVGHQCHTGHPVSMARHLEVLDDLSRAGLPVQITEFWVKAEGMPGTDTWTPRQREQWTAGYVEDFYTLAFGHPAVSHLCLWGSGIVFQGKGFDRPSATGLALHRLLHETWRTSGVATTGADGRATVRGFHGRYRIQTGPSTRPDTLCEVDLPPGTSVQVDRVFTP